MEKANFKKSGAKDSSLVNKNIARQENENEEGKEKNINVPTGPLYN